MEVANFIKYKSKLILLFSILLLILLIKTSHDIRSVGYAQSPESNFLDEYTNVWHGLSIRTTGVPAAWSDLRSYWDFWEKYHLEVRNENLKDFNLTLNNVKPKLLPQRNFPKLIIFTTEMDFGAGMRHTSLMQPYLDHPPLGAIVLSLLVPKTSDNFYKITPYDSRKTSIFLADLSTILIFILGFQLFKNPIIGLISAGVYASGPTFLFTSRYALLENVLIPFQLLSLNFLVLGLGRFKDNLRVYRSILLISGIFAGFAFLSKTTGISVTLAGFITLLFFKDKRNILFFILPALLLSSLYFIWGMILSPNIFLSLLAEQSQKRIFVGSLNFITAAFKYGSRSFPLDGWWFGGFLALLFLKNSKQLFPFIAGLLAMLFIILFSGASSFPWYFIPLIPFMSIATGNLFYNIATNPKLIEILLMFLVFFSSTYFWAYGVYNASPNFNNHQQQFFIYKVILSISFLAAVLVPFFHKRSSIFRILWFIAILLIILVLVGWNFKSIIYMLQHWGKLMENYSPNWKL